MRHSLYTATALALALASASASAQEQARQPWRTRIALGAQVVPSFPGSEEVSVRPLVDVARARGDTPFEFEAADESFGPGLLKFGGLEIGPAVSFEGKRSLEDTNGLLPEVDFTIEAGGYVQFQLTPALRIRAEARQGLGGHEGLIGMAGADYVARDGDKWLFSIGPRVTFADGKYQRAYFGVDAPSVAAVAGGLTPYRPEDGVEAVGATAGLVFQLTPRWGIYSYAKYDRLVGDAADSPVTRVFGSRDQFSGGAALTYTFGPVGR